MIRITRHMLLYGAILFLLTMLMLVLTRGSGTVTGVVFLGGWAVGYTVVTWLFLRREDQAKTRINLKLSYGLIAVIAVLPTVIIADILVSPATENPLKEKLWLLPSLIVIVLLNIALQQRRLKGYRKQEVFK